MEESLKSDDIDIELMFWLAEKYVGLPYIWGAESPLVGFDCSGLICELFYSIGMLPTNLRLNAQGLYNHFEPSSEIGLKERGALAFFGKAIDSITHIALLLTSRHILEAGGGDSKAINKEAAIVENAYVRVRPLSRRKDLVVIMKPNYNF